MADLTFLTPEDQTVKRELLIAYLNTGTASSPAWSAIGKRVEDSSEEYDWEEESATDILGVERTTLKRPTITQSFDPVKLDSADSAIVKIWNIAIKDRDAQALAAQDMLIVHFYAGTTSSSSTAYFAERYKACAVRPTGLGGEGGGDISMPIDVTYGGERVTGTAAKGSDGEITFTADT